MRRQEGIKRYKTNGREQTEKWQGFASITLFITIAISLLGGWLGIWLSPTPALTPVLAVIGVMAGGYGGFACWILTAVRFGLYPRDDE